MVDQELIERVIRLSVPERLELIELLTQSLRIELAMQAHQPTKQTELRSAEIAEETTRALAAIERLAQSFSLDLPPDSSLRRILGVVPSDAVPMTKDAVRNLIANYLIEKHS